jgi:hypothetical protein
MQLGSSIMSLGTRGYLSFEYLSLAVKGAIESNTDLMHILERCRAIVSFFNQSTVATSTLTRLCLNLTKKAITVGVLDEMELHNYHAPQPVGT